MAFTPQSFLSNINSKGGLARPNRFQVVLSIPSIVADTIIANDTFGDRDGPNEDSFAMISIGNYGNVGSKATLSRWLSLQCEQAELPGKQLQTVDAKIYGPTYKIPFQAQYSDITLQFLCTTGVIDKDNPNVPSSSSFYERKLFDRWLENIVPNNTNNARFPKGSGIGGGYLTRIMVVQFDDYIKQIYAVELIDAFPISIAAQPLSWNDDNFHRVSVQFSYQKFKTIYTGENVNDLADQVFGGIDAYNRSVTPGAHNSVLYTDSGATNRNLPSTGIPVDLNLFNLKNQFTARYLNQQVLQPFNTAKRQITDAFRI